MVFVFSANKLTENDVFCLSLIPPDFL